MEREMDQPKKKGKRWSQADTEGQVEQGRWAEGHREARAKAKCTPRD